MYVGMGPDKVREMFDELEDNTVLFIDEADALLKARSEGSSGGETEFNNTVNQFLACTEGIGNDGRRIMIILATNKAKQLDPAVKSRCHYQIKVKAPTAEERKQHFPLQMRLQNLKAAGPIDWDEAVRLSAPIDCGRIKGKERTRSMSGRMIRNIVAQVRDSLLGSIPAEEKRRLEGDEKALRNFELKITSAQLLQGIRDNWKPREKPGIGFGH